MNQSPWDRRRHPRCVKHQLVVYARYYNYCTFQQLGVGATLDLSISGMRLQTPKLLQPDWIPEFRIALGNDIVSVRGKIVHIEVDRGCPVTGVEFMLFREGHQRRLERFLEGQRLRRAA